MFAWKKKYREKIRRRSFPSEWIEFIRENVPYFRALPEEDRKELLGDILVFLDEKHFEGCGGLEITDEIRVTIAAEACILQLHRKNNNYPRLRSILVYPHAYQVTGRKVEPGGFIREGVETRGGESWSRGSVVLSWDDVRKSAADIHDGHNVALHEFAHQLDQEDGSADGAPVLPHRSMYLTWARVLGKEYQDLLTRIESHHPVDIDPYGAISPAEFFAVVTEYFFEKPVRLKRKHPELYEELRLFYNQDPAALLS
ncbi:MAG: zinc-dependent peptidase [Candidatus Euphemobacter frigidus]|nr:zinc-dependent peptidase [Candidatus Euphemobacter frigidus]MDP8276134.1 zinc-dependent peptidase [Candidatus Euphemobacter frigidus]